MYNIWSRPTRCEFIDAGVMKDIEKAAVAAAQKDEEEEPKEEAPKTDGSTNS